MIFISFVCLFVCVCGSLCNIRLTQEKTSRDILKCALTILLLSLLNLFSLFSLRVEEAALSQRVLESRQSCGMINYKGRPLNITKWRHLLNHLCLTSSYKVGVLCVFNIQYTGLVCTDLTGSVISKFCTVRTVVSSVNVFFFFSFLPAHSYIFVTLSALSVCFFPSFF